MEHDLQLRAAARAIYDACYPSEEWAPVGFEEAERFRTVHYRQAVGAAQRARVVLADRAVQPSLFAEPAPLTPDSCPLTQIIRTSKFMRMSDPLARGDLRAPGSLDKR